MESFVPVPKGESHYHGLLVVDKPGLEQIDPAYPVGEDRAVDDQPTGVAPTHSRLFTSHDIVQRVRRWSAQRRIGHTGTLDPMASGVLVLCLGKATRLVEYYQGHEKQYEAVVTLGRATDTYDCTGKVTSEKPVPPLTVTAIEDLLAQFRGDILQVPPVYSALKKDGESLHRRARRGEEITLDPRPVSFYQLDLIGYNPPHQLELQVRCSAGAYIRSLAHDIGQVLQVGAHLSRLRRVAAGVFSVADSHTLAEIDAMARNGRLDDLLLPLGVGLSFPRIQLTEEAAQRLGFGQEILLPAVDGIAMGALGQGIDASGLFRGILRSLKLTPDGALWKAEKWFDSPSS